MFIKTRVIKASEADRMKQSAVKKGFTNGNILEGEAARMSKKMGRKKFNKYMLFSIHDEGVGIPKRQQARVFEKFFRGDNVIIMQTEGSGLGLYICKAIVESSGGNIWFESSKDMGSTFYFTLPIK